MKSEKFKESNYEFVPFVGESRKTLALKKKIVRAQFLQSIPKRVQGAWIPMRVAGPLPQVEFNLEDKTLTVSGPGIPATDFIPISRKVAIEEFISDGQTETEFSRILDRYPNDTNFVVVDKNGSNFNAQGRGKKGFIRKLIQDWINAYGWAQKNSEKGAHDLGDWFVGLAIIHGGELL